jgi:hypothetical protein
MSVTVFEHVNFGGWRQDLDHGTYNAVRRGGFVSPNPINDEISSFILGPYTEVTFFEHVDFGGDSIKFINNTPLTQEHPFMDANWNDKVSSVIVVGLFGQQTPPDGTVEEGLVGVILYAGYDRRASEGIDPLNIMSIQRFDVGKYTLPVNLEYARNGVPWLTKFGLQPKSVSSVSVGKGFYLDIFDETDARATVHKNIDDLQTIGWNNRITKIEVHLLGP